MAAGRGCDSGFSGPTLPGWRGLLNGLECYYGGEPRTRRRRDAGPGGVSDGMVRVIEGLGVSLRGRAGDAPPVRRR